MDRNLPVAQRSPFGAGAPPAKKGNPAQIQGRVADFAIMDDIKPMRIMDFDWAVMPAPRFLDGPDPRIAHRERLIRDMQDIHRRIDAAPVTQRPDGKVVPSADDIENAISVARALLPMVSLVIGEKPGHKYEYAKDKAANRVLTAAMNELGWDYLGGGNFSVVFGKGGMAIKFGLKPEDSGAAYAAWCRANQGKAGVPVLYDIERGKHGYIVVMDRCYPSGENYGPFCDWLRHLASGSARLSPALDRDMTARYPALAATVREIHAFFKGVAEMDLHGENWMRDRDGNVVITDPVSFRAGSR